MTRILVTGGAGFIGSHLVDQLLGQGHRVVVFDDFSFGRRDFLPNHPALEIIEDRLANLESYSSLLDGTETIFHLAALISSHDSLREPARYLEVNTGGTLCVINLARRAGVKRIVFASSSTVYGDADEPQRSEDDVPQPISAYALSKLASEHLLSMYGPMYGFSSTSLRFFNVYGPRQSPDHPYANVTCKFAYAAANGERVDLYGDCMQTRDFIYVADVVTALILVRDCAPFPVYNVGTGTSVSIQLLLKEAERAAGVTLERRQLPPWPNDIRNIRASIERIKQDFGFRPQVDLAKGLANTVDYFKRTQR